MKPFLFFLTILVAFSCTMKNPANFDLKNIQEKNPEISVLKNGEVLKISPNNEHQSLTVWEGNNSALWKNANYLVCEILHENDFSGILNIEFYRNEKGNEIVTQSGSVAGDAKQTPRMATKSGVTPKLKTKVIFPLEHLNAQEIFMPRFLLSYFSVK